MTTAQGPPSSSMEEENLAGLFKNPIVQQLWAVRQQAKQQSLKAKAARNKDKLSSTSSTTDTTPVGKTPSESRVQVSYPFSSDIVLAEAYRNPWGHVRLGKLLEDLDALAGNIAFFHVDQSTSQHAEHPIIVTASVDRIRLQQRPPRLTVDQELQGQVTWTGTSSMEIRMQCQSVDQTEPWLEAYVTFVTLDPHTKRPTTIPKVLPHTKEEHKAFAAGQERANRKRQKRKQQSVPSSTTQMEELAQRLMDEAGPLLNMPSLADPHSILLSNTKMQNAMMAQPQVQNLHNRIFGGFLVRRAFELAFANAYVFGGVRPIFLEVDEVSFARPVDVGDLLVFNSRVLYTDEGSMENYHEDSSEESTTTLSSSSSKRKVPFIHVEVEAWVTEPEKASAKVSNRFYFTFACSKSDQPVRRVLPGTIDEARRMAIRMIGDQEQDNEES